MTWPKLIIFAVATAVYTALINQVPFLEGTSFRDIAISFEWWVFFAMIIMLNAKSPLDSALKTFVFFLISQPLIYLIEVPFQGWQIMQYYRNWVLWTIFTFPMAFAGYYLKKGNWLSLLILTPAILFLGNHCFEFLKSAIYLFPHHLLSALFCLATIIIYVLVIFEHKKEKIVAFSISAVTAIAVIVLVLTSPINYTATLKCSDEEFPFDDTYSVYMESPKMGTVSIEKRDDYYTIDGDFSKPGKTILTIEDSKGNKKNFDLIVGLNTYTLTESK